MRSDNFNCNKLISTSYLCVPMRVYIVQGEGVVAPYPRLVKVMILCSIPTQIDQK